jgi:CubicO group peptidase (beta-lactamase class C family)/D-alanyl-D-alanine dipeptidase
MNRGFVSPWIASLIMAATMATQLPAEEGSPDLAQVEQVVSGLVAEQGIPGLSVAVATDNELLFAKGYGQADVENAVAATDQTRYRTASIAKSMTAVVVMSLAEDGAIDLDADVQNYCPDFPRKQWTITPRHLLGHLGGVRHYKNTAETTSTKHFFSLDSALGTFRDDPLLHQPGTKYLYTTFGYNLLGSVAEGAGQSRFAELLQEKVFRPAEMSKSVVDDQRALISGRARGYVRPTAGKLKSLPADHGLVPGELYNAPLHDTSMKIPGGGLLSTAPDLVRFAIACNTGELLDAASRDQMWTRQKTTAGKETKYGLGWRVNRRAGRKVVSHTGGQSGTTTVLVLVPETGTAVALMCNLQHAKLRETALEIAALVQPPPPPTDYAPAIEKLKSVIRYEVEQKQLPAFSIALVDRDATVWAEGFGFQDTQQQVPATADTVYRVGSVSKLFTDIAVMQKVEAGELDLDAPIKKYLPEFHPHDPHGVPITLQQLMSHRSGLVRESPIGNYFDPTEPTLAATVASLNGTSLVYKPETRTKYSNAAIAVVGAVLEKQLDTSHADQVQQTILDPLDMKQSSFVVTPAVKAKLATGWMRTYDGRRFEAPVFLLGTGPAGNLYSSANDLSKFLSCMFNEGQTSSGPLLKRATYRQMTTPLPDSDGKPQAFGLGFHIQELDGYTKIGHGGAVYGFSTQLEAVPQRRVGVAAVASLDGSNGVVRRITDYALRLMIAAQDGKPLPEYRTTDRISAERARELVGTYREVDGKRFTRISELDGEVTMQRGSYRYELRAAADDGTVLTDDPAGFGVEVKLLASNQIRVGDVSYTRMPDEAPDDIPDRWRGLIGEYGWDHNTLYILEDNGQLYALIEWFYYYPLKEISENVFEFPDYGLYHGEGLKFTRDTGGVATKVVAAEVEFMRREVGTKDGETFRITPVKPIDELRDAALAASPHDEQGEFREAELVELVTLDPTIDLDVRYASTNNFTGAVFYKQPRAFMQRPAAEAVVRAHRRLEPRGLGLLIHDAYRPWHVTKMFWDATPDNLKAFVANPANGSRHNRGCAVDLTLYDLESGEPIQMVAGYDEFSPRSFPLYPGGTARQRWYRELLRRTMEAEGFTIYEFEWWHFDFKDWKKYRIGNVTFEAVAP